MSCRASRAPKASAGTLITQRRPGRSSPSTTRASSFSLSRRSLSSGAGSGATKASDLPSGDHAVCQTSDFVVVRRQASPPAVGSSQTLAYLSPRLEMKASHLPSGDQRGRPEACSANVICRDSLPSVVESQICVRYSLLSLSMTVSRATKATRFPSGDTWTSETGRYFSISRGVHLSGGPSAASPDIVVTRSATPIAAHRLCINPPDASYSQPRLRNQ